MMVLFFVRQYFSLGCWGGVAKVDFFWLHRVFVAAPGLSLVVASGGLLSSGGAEASLVEHWL